MTYLCQFGLFQLNGVYPETARRPLVSESPYRRVANQRCDLFGEFIKRWLNDYRLAHTELLIIHDLKLCYYRALWSSRRVWCVSKI